MHTTLRPALPPSLPPAPSPAPPPVRFTLRPALQLLTATLLLASGASHANLLTNGSFENLSASWVPDASGGGYMAVGPAQTGVLPGWVVSSVRPVAWVMDGNRYGLAASEGSFHIDLSGPLDGPVFDEVATAFDAVVGARYRISFDIGVNHGSCFGAACGGPVGVAVTVVSAFDIPAFLNYDPPGGGQQWQRVSVDFTAQDPRTVIRLTGAQGQQYIGLDNVVVEALPAVPEPASWALWMLGGAGLASRLRSRKRRSDWPQWRKALAAAGPITCLITALASAQTCAQTSAQTPAQAADTSCAALAKAVRAGISQPRIHAAIDAPLDAAAMKAGMKPTLMHSIVIDQVQHSNALSPGFRRVALTSPDQRELATDLVAFEAETGCKATGNERIGGRTAQVWAFSTDLGRGEARIKVWVDSASGLPLRAVSDEPDFDIGASLAKPASTKTGAARIEAVPNGQRVIGTHAYLYGESVKPPGPKGELDAVALSQLQALLKGTP